MIKEAAIKREDDNKIWTGHRHPDCFEEMKLDGIVSLAGSIYIQGFVTDTGEFLDRKEAFKHAVICNQVEDPDDGKERILISEDLY